MSVNTEKTPKVEFKFSPMFLKTVDLLLTSYQNGIRILNDINKNPNKIIDHDAFGVCDNSYKLRYVTPHDVATFVSYVGKLMNSNGPFTITNVGDGEKMAVAMIQRFVNDNEKCVPFEDTNAYGSDDYINQRTITLPTLLVMMRNEFYDTNVYSRYDMCERAKAITDDLKLMNALNFPVNIRKLIMNIPKIMMDSCEELKYSRPLTRMVTDLIERFIQTVCALNLCTIEQLSKYCIPRTSFDITKLERGRRLDFDFYKEEAEEDEELRAFDKWVFTEAVNLQQYKPVFINLSTGGNNFVSNSIKKATGEEYSHSSISFDPTLEVMYTFNGGPGLDNKYGIQKPGFQREALRSSKFKGVRVTTYCVFVPNETYAKMLRAVEDMEKSNPKYDYKAIADRWHAINKYGNDANPKRTDNTKRQVCSTFVNSILSVAGDPLGDKEIVSPGELGKAAEVRPNEVFKIYDGPGENYDPDEAMAKIQQFMEKSTTHAYASPYTEYVTECCLLKTNGMRIHSKIPFNCNMRDIVLQDMHPQFKDTRSAIMFMVSDERSPITGLLRKYRTVEAMQPQPRVLNMFMRLKDPTFVIKTDEDRIRNCQLSMHTDVNWLDKIAYGNLFLDGNYRADALGNNKFTPIENTLCHLYSMYAPEDMKDNTSLANNVVDVANAMISAIDQYNDPQLGGCVYDWEMFRDILATFGEILTRSMLKLYHNNATLVYASDDMEDTMSAGYMYNESFEMFLEADDPKPSGGPAPTVKVTSTTNKEGAQKVLGNIMNVIRRFIAWCSRAFQQMLSFFKNNHDAEINWVKSHSQLNQEIGKALGNGFDVQVANYRPYHVKGDVIAELKLNDALKPILTQFRKPEAGVQNLAQQNSVPTDALELFKLIIDKSGIDQGVKAKIKAATDPTVAQTILKNYFLYGPQVAQSENDPEKITAPTKLTPQMWTEIVDDLTKSENLVQKIADDSKNQVAKTNQDLEKLAKDIEADKAKPAEQQKFRDHDIFTSFCTAYTQNVSQYISGAINNSIGKYFYAKTYKVYREVIAAYKSRYDASKAQSTTPQTQAKPQEQGGPPTPTETGEGAGANAGATGASGG